MTQPDESTVDSTEDDAANVDTAPEATDDANDGDDDDSKFDPAIARRKIEKANREAKNLRDELKKLKPLADEAEKRRKGEQTESQRLTEEKAALESQIAELRTANVRRDAAEAANLPAKFTKFITASDPDEALAQAKELAKELKQPDEKKPAADFRQGARGANNSGSNVNSNDLLRQMARQR